MTELPADCLREIFEFLTITDWVQVRQVSKGWRFSLSQDRLFFSSALKKHFLPPSLHSILSINSEDSYRLILMLSHLYRNGLFGRMEGKVVFASSSDRWEESAINMASIIEKPEQRRSTRKCYSILDSNPDLPMAIAQMLCRCNHDNPCYWSSAPSQDQNSSDWLILECDQFCFVDSILIRPYQAAWHPNSPIYGPMEVYVEFLEPNPTNHYPPLPSRRNRRNSFRYDSRSIPNERIYYQSPALTLRHSRDAQLLQLPTPQLLLGGKMRLNFRGKYQRQTMGGDDYYLCLNPCEIFGIPIRNCQIDTELSEGDEAIVSRFNVHHIDTSSWTINTADAGRVNHRVTVPILMT